jgi:hypothetical protein
MINPRLNIYPAILCEKLLGAYQLDRQTPRHCPFKSIIAGEIE